MSEPYPRPERVNEPPKYTEEATNQYQAYVTDQSDSDVLSISLSGVGDGSPTPSEISRSYEEEGGSSSPNRYGRINGESRTEEPSAWTSHLAESQQMTSAIDAASQYIKARTSGTTLPRSDQQTHHRTVRFAEASPDRGSGASPSESYGTDSWTSDSDPSQSPMSGSEDDRNYQNAWRSRSRRRYHPPHSSRRHRQPKRSWNRDRFRERWFDKHHDVSAADLAIPITYHWLETDGLAKLLPITHATETDSDITLGPSSSAEATAWSQPKTYLEEDTTTELRVIHNIEFSTYAASQYKVVLTSFNEPNSKQPAKQPEDPGVMRWLHIQRHSLRLDILERLVRACPFISSELMPVVITVIDDVSGRLLDRVDRTSSIDSGKIVRYTGHVECHGGDSVRQTVPVTFLSVPYLALKAVDAEAAASGYRSGKPLLHSLYGYDTGVERELKQVVQKLSIASGQEALHESQLWLLTVGSEIMITFGQVSSQFILGDLVTFIEGSTGKDELHVITLIDQFNHRYTITVKADCNYVDMLRHAVTLASPPPQDPDDFELLDNDKHPLTPLRWLNMLTSSPSARHVLRLRRKHRPQLPPVPFPDVNNAPMHYPPQREQSIEDLGDVDEEVRASDSGEGPFDETADNLFYGDECNSLVQYRGGRADGWRSVVNDASSRRRDVESLTTGHYHSTGLSSENSHEQSLPPRAANISARQHSEVALIHRFYQEPADGVSRIEINEAFQDLISPAYSLPRRLPPPSQSRMYSSSRLLDSRRNYTPVRHSQLGSRQEILSEIGPLVLWQGQGVSSDGLEDNIKDETWREGRLVVDPSYSRRMPAVVSAGVKRNAQEPESEKPPLSLKRDPAPYRISQKSRRPNSKYNWEGRRSSRWKDRDPPPVHQFEETSLPSSPIPFFKWRLRSHPRHRTKKQVDQDLRTVLDQIDEEVRSGRVRRAYNDTFKCTKKELLGRHLFPLSADSYAITGDQLALGRSQGPVAERRPASVEPANTQQQQQRQSPSDGDIIIEPLFPNSGQSREASRPPMPGTHEVRNDVSGETTPVSGTKDLDTQDPCTKIMAELLQVTEGVMWAFLSADGQESMYESAHRVCKSVWGAVDTVCRQTLWAGIHSQKSGSEPLRYVVRDFGNCRLASGDGDERGNTQQLSWTDCADCKAAKKYDTPDELLNHINTNHTQTTVKQLRPFDDASFCWVSPTQMATDENTLSTWLGYSIIKDFIESMEAVSKVSRELIYYMARPGSRFAEDGLTPSPLPKTLTTAFCNILANYILVAKCLALTNRSGYTSNPEEKDVVLETISDLELTISSAFKQVFDVLEKARSDIILLCSTRREVDCLHVQSVDLPFLTLLIIKNVERFTLDTKQLSHGIIEKRHADDKNRVDVIAVYQHYLSVLQFHARNRPQKRVFLEIQNYQEELSALGHLTQLQIQVLRYHISLLQPGSFRLTSRRRLEQHGTEYKFWMKIDKTLTERLDHLSVLDDQAHSLKEEVKNAIEIIEEDHGKAIRVFTVVTLFFLPLSFISSFMGMNTTDIRETTSDQRLFWSVAVPVTIAVIAVAFTYGYAGDSISDWLHSRFRPHKRAPEWTGTAPLRHGLGALDLKKTASFKGRQTSWKTSTTTHQPKRQGTWESLAV